MEKRCWRATIWEYYILLCRTRNSIIERFIADGWCRNVKLLVGLFILRLIICIYVVTCITKKCKGILWLCFNYRITAYVILKTFISSPMVLIVWFETLWDWSVCGASIMSIEGRLIRKRTFHYNFIVFLNDMRC